MSPKKDPKRRGSILKKRRSNEDELTEVTISKIQKKTHFSQKNLVKEFVECSERVTIWGSTYETSAIKSDGSYENANASATITAASYKSSGSSVQAAPSIPRNIQDDTEKENFIIYTDAPSSRQEEEEQIAIASANSTSESESRSSVELTLFMEASENKRIQNYGTDNVNITNIALDTSSVEKCNQKNWLNPSRGENIVGVLSPRKMIFNNHSNMSVVIKDKVLLNLPYEDSVSFSFELDEGGGEKRRPQVSAPPPSTSQPLKAAPATSMTSEPKAVIFSTPMVFKTRSTETAPKSAPPAATAHPREHGHDIDDVFKMIISDTPIKNLCCLGKNCTPTRSDKKVIFSAPPRPDTLPRKSINLFEEFEMLEKDKGKGQGSSRKTLFLNEPMSVDKTTNRKTISGPAQVRIIIDPPLPDSRKSILFNDSIQMDDGGAQQQRQASPHPESYSLGNTTDLNLEDIIGEDTFQSNQKLKMYVNKKIARKSIIANDSMQLEEGNGEKNSLQEFEMIEKDTEKTPRKTILTNDAIKIDSKNVIRKTTYDTVTMQIQDSKLTSQKLPETRKTIMFNDSMQMDDGAAEMAKGRRQTRQTLLHPEMIDIDDACKSFGASNTTDLNLEDVIGEDTFHTDQKPQTHIKKMSRKSVITNESMQLEELEMADINPATKSRKTILGNDSIKIESKHSNRKTTYDTVTMQIVDQPLDLKLNAQKPAETRKTIMFNDSMQLTDCGAEFAKGRGQTRQTLLYPEMIDIDDACKSFGASNTTDLNLEDVIGEDTFHTDQKPQMHIKKMSRKSVITNESMQLEELEMADINPATKSRKTILGNDSIKIESKNGIRKTTYDTVTMQIVDQTLGTKSKQPNPAEARKTILFNESMQMTDEGAEMMAKGRNLEHFNGEDTFQTDQKSQMYINNMTRKSVITNDSMQIEEENEEKNSLNVQKVHTTRNACRKTIYPNESMNIAGSAGRRTIFDNMQAKEMALKSVIADCSMQIADENSIKEYQMIREEEMAASQPKRQTLFLNESMMVDKNAGRKTTFETVKMETIEPSPQHARRTIVLNESMQMGADATTTEPDLLRDAAACLPKELSYRSVPHSIIDRRRTYTKDVSMKWHDITDQEFVNMIDDESNPCLNSTDPPEPVSSEELAISIYENATQDFINVTIADSPLNETLARRRSVQLKSRRQSRIPSPIKNYDTMFEDLMADLKKKNQPQPRLEIDEYLERMQIGQVKIPRYPQNDSKCLVERINEKFREHKERTQRRSRLSCSDSTVAVTQFPEIPPAKFLFKNAIDCMEEELSRKIRDNNSATVSPVFPESIDFEGLLRNKFDTDETLSKFWLLNTVFWWKKSFKLTHWKMPMFTINFQCQQSNAEVNESTIPIIFKNVTLYVNPEYRKSSNESRRNLLVRNEFKRALSMKDNFTSMCESSRELLSFLDVYHESVMRTIHLVDNFFKILVKYDAVYSPHPQNFTNRIKKMLFFECEREIVKLSITVDGYIEDLSAKDLSIEGRRFTYELQPRASLDEMRGLMFVELVLFDTEKFFYENTVRRRIERPL